MDEHRETISNCSIAVAPWNVAACLVPNGNLRMEVFGLETRPPTGDELRRMGRMVREAMEQGAVGLSTGLDYIPESICVDPRSSSRAMCPGNGRSCGGVYVTHQRRYDPDGVLESMDEVYRIGRESGVPVHISHFNSRAEVVLPKMDQGRRQGIDVTYDLYCYLAGSTILGMKALPPWVQLGGIDATLARLRDAGVRERLRDWFFEHRDSLESTRLGFVARPDQRNLEGMTIVEAAESTGKPIGDLICDLLIDSDMAIGCVVPHQRRTGEDIRQLMRHPCMTAGSDGIYAGSHPHPLADCGMLPARYLGHYVRDEPTWVTSRRRCSTCRFRRLRLAPASA